MKRPELSGRQLSPEARWSVGAEVRRGVVAAVISGLTVAWLLMLSPGRLAAPSEHASRLPALELTHSWQDGRPVLELVGPALALTASRVGPALLLALGVALLLARRSGLWAERVRYGMEGASIFPLFLLGYLAILGVNRVVAAGVGHGLPAPDWFALPIGDGEPHPVRWGLEVLVLGVGDGALGLAVGRVRSQVVEISSRPYVLAAEVNAAAGGAVVRRHLRAPVVRLAAALLPLLLGGAVVVETLFQEPGAGRLLVDRLEARDLPVVGALLSAGLLLTVTAQTLARGVRERI